MKHAYLGERVALLLMGKDPQGEDDWAVLAGTVIQQQERLLFQHAHGALELSDEWASRIKPAAPETKSILGGAQYVLPLVVGNITDEEAASLQGTGLKWPIS